MFSRFRGRGVRAQGVGGTMGWAVDPRVPLYLLQTL